MLLYITIIISSIISLIGIFFKTKEEVKSTGSYRLTRSGWLLVIFILTLSSVSIFIQVQRDKIQKLQEANAEQKKRADSLDQVNQKKTLELLLAGQIEKSRSDSLLLTSQINKLDSVRFNQSMSLSEQRSTLQEQRVNASYLRNKLQEEERNTASLVYPLNTLYLTACITIQLRDSVRAEFDSTMQEDIAPDDRVFGRMSGVNLLPIIKKHYPEFFRYMSTLAVVIIYRKVEGIPINDMFSQFFTNDYLDSVNLRTGRQNGCYSTSEIQHPQVIFYKYGNDYRLDISLVKSAELTTTYTTSLKDLCDKKLHIQLNSTLSTDKRFIKEVAFKCIQLETPKAHITCDQIGKGATESGDYYDIQYRAFSGKASCHMF